jgi:hypothetical protein
MKNNSFFRPIAAISLGTLLLYLSFQTVSDDKDKNVVVHTSRSNVKQNDTLLPLSEPIFDSIGVPTLISKLEKDKSIRLNTLKVRTKIQQNVAVTRYEMTFFNPNLRNLEAELNFPLGEGQTITRFAMDVNGKMCEGVAIEKERARVAFETTIRQNIDPGLVEMTKGNNFKARVFPVPSNGFKRIILEYTEELHPRNGAALYFLPLGFNEKIPQFALTVDVIDKAAEPSVIKSQSKTLEFKKVNHIFSASLSKSDFIPNEPLTVKVKLPEDNDPVIAAKEKDKTYFHCSLEVPNRFREKTSPKNLTVLWDVSGSRSAASSTKEMDLLKGYLSSLGNPTITIVTFANKIVSKKKIAFNPKRNEQLSYYLEALEYDGGSDLSSIPFDRFHSDEILLFTDGLNNLGPSPKQLGKTRIYTITSSLSADQALLRSIAARADGVFIDLMKCSIEEGLNKLKMDQLHFMGFSNDKGIQEYYPRKATAVNGSLGISGVTNGSIKKLTALYGYGNQVTVKQAIELSGKTGNLQTAKKLWAMKKIEHLYADKRSNKKLITQLGIQERLVTSNTSLLVLDRVEDYVEHEIVPPSELQKEYFKLLNRSKKQKAAQRKYRMKHVFTDFKEQRDWWTKKRQKTEKKVQETQVQEMQVHFSEPVADQAEESMEAMRAPELSRSEQRDGIAASEIPSGTYSTIVTNVNGASTTFASNATAYTYSLTVSGSDQPSGAIHVKGWDPKSPYMTRIKKASEKDLYAAYLKEKPKYGDQPSFYLDVADHFMKKGKDAEAMRILTNIAELELENHSLLRILAHRLLQMKEEKKALFLFRELVELRPEEPQSYRDLGLAYGEIGENEKAVRYLYKVVSGDFDERFRGIQLIAMNEINALLASTKKSFDISYIDERLLSKMPVDIRVVLNWDADNTDVDLWVTDPSGEKCFYSNKYTKQGGRISNDFTQGYGPEEFMLKKALKGKYRIQAHYYGSSSQSIEGKATLTVQFFKQYGTKHQIKQEITRRLNVQSEVIDLGTFEF